MGEKNLDKIDENSVETRKGNKKEKSKKSKLVDKIISIIILIVCIIGLVISGSMLWKWVQNNIESNKVMIY